MSDVTVVVLWWSTLFFAGAAAFPLTKKLFSSWYDQGYFFSKAVGMATATYIVYVLGTLHIMPFTQFSVAFSLGAIFILGIFLQIFNSQLPISKQFSKFNIQIFIENYKPALTHLFRRGRLKIVNLRKNGWSQIGLCVSEELFFFSALFGWSWVKAHEPSIRGLEKFMDFGFMQSILNSQWFPAPDMWYAGGSINYYYFGHLVTAVLTKLSGIDLGYTFNLMLAAIFALMLTMSFSIGVQLQRIRRQHNTIGDDNPEIPSTKHQKSNNRVQITNSKHYNFLNLGFVWKLKFVICDLTAGFLTAFLVTLAGNMQTLYAFTKGYTGDSVVPFWTVLYPVGDFFAKVGEGMNRYWYANATRFIPFTIHEFPGYSFVVSDVHGHVLSIPFVLLSIALLITLFVSSVCGSGKFQIIFYGFLLGILLMTNALDGAIYLLLFLALLIPIKGISNIQWKKIIILLSIAVVIAGVTAAPFLVHFNSFASGIGVNCPPGFLQNSRIGPILFESADKCQKSPLWMMTLLWGFFWFSGIWLFVKHIWSVEERNNSVHHILQIFFLFALLLVIIPEFFYVKDIYPMHFRSNTMFKLGYQAFILWSIVASHVIVHFLFQRNFPQIFNFKFLIFNKNFKFQISNFNRKIQRIFWLLLIPQLFLVSIFPIFAVRSYFNQLQTYQGIYGLSWLIEEYPDDWEAITWMKYQISNIKYQINTNKIPVIVEADGDSYTEYNHISAFSGLPTVVGWAVHEWLWRGTYDVVAPRRAEVQQIYESGNPDTIRLLLKKYGITYIIVGKLEREKFKNLREDVIFTLATPVFTSGETVIYQFPH